MYAQIDLLISKTLPRGSAPKPSAGDGAVSAFAQLLGLHILSFQIKEGEVDPTMGRQKQ